MKTNQQVAAEILMGKWGNGEERKKRLREAGYNYDAVQSIVNSLVAGTAYPVEVQTEEFKITGTETMKVEIDITKYNCLELTFTDGSEE